MDLSTFGSYNTANNNNNKKKNLKIITIKTTTIIIVVIIIVIIIKLVTHFDKLSSVTDLHINSFSNLEN